MGDPAARAIKSTNVATSSTAGPVVPAVTKTTTGVVVQALLANTAAVFLGGSDVTTANGYELQPGDSVFLPVDGSVVFGVSVAAQNLRVLVF